MTQRPGGPIWSAAVGGGGAGLWSSPSGLGWAGVLQCLRRGEQFRRAAFRVLGGWAWIFWVVSGGRVRATGQGVGRGAWAFPRWVFAGCRVWGVVRGVRRVGPWRVCAVLWAGGGGPCRGARGCARWWACVGVRVGSEGGGAWAGIALGVALCRCMCLLAAARLCGQL